MILAGKSRRVGLQLLKNFVELVKINPAMKSSSSRTSRKEPRKLPAKQEKSRFNKECTIPPRVPDVVLNRFTLGRNENEADQISSYVEWQCAKDKEHVTYLEKVMTEPVFGTRHDCWNVRTNKERYWVITNPTNLYSQELFPSLDYTLSFHIGLTVRMQAQRKGTSNDRLADRLASAFRRWEQAAEALDHSEESEEIQAVGMRCRECLVALVRSVASPAMIPKGQESPKASDFIHWSELIADAVAPGPSYQEIRSYLKTIARSTWQLVSWLTHAANAVTYDGTVAVNATQEVLNSFGNALMRSERKAMDRCPHCGSLRLQMIYKPDSDHDDAVLCESCGWNK
ncbi:MAG: hypothetical protein ACLPYZ_12720 [Limisphaerales bacterium]